MTDPSEVVRCLLLVVGAGAAGLIAALEATAAGRVIVVSAAAPEGGTSHRAQGGIAGGESRGSRVRADAPREDPSLLGHLMLSAGGAPVLESWS